MARALQAMNAGKQDLRVLRSCLIVVCAVVLWWLVGWSLIKLLQGLGTDAMLAAGAGH
jgi:hypothetical protein